VDFTKVSETEISTVFLEIDHGYWSRRLEAGLDVPNGVDTRPLLFETMIFGGKYNHYQCRYRTLAEAKRGHWEVVDGVRNETLLDDRGD